MFHWGTVTLGSSKTFHASGHADEADHLPAELVKANEINGVLEYAAAAAVILRRGQEYALGRRYLFAKSEYVAWVLGLVSATSRAKRV